MNDSQISFRAIDFSKYDCEFVYKGKIYQITQYLNKYFFKDKNYQGYDFIYSFAESYLAEKLCNKNGSPVEIAELLLRNSGYIERCVEYEQTIFCFSVNQERYFEQRGSEERYFEQISGKGVHFSRQYESWIFVDWEPPKCLDLDEILELPPEFFLQQAIAACDRGLLAAFNFQAIDFSQPDGEFCFQGQIYQVKQYLDKYFFKPKLDKSNEFIYSFAYIFADLVEIFCQPQAAAEVPIEFDLEQEASIQRCIEYAGTIFCLGLGYGYRGEYCYTGEYCSFKSRYWIPVDWQVDRELTLNDILHQPKEFFIKQAHTAQLPCFLHIYDEEIHPALRAAYKFAGAKPLEFVRGCEAEIRHLTRIAAYVLPELQPLFERCSNLKVVYISDSGADDGGFNSIYTGEREDWPNWLYKENFSRQARQLFQLIYEHDLFTGSHLERAYGGCGFDCYELFPLSITIEVQAPLQHEKLAATLELQAWLADKLPEIEIKAYLEGNYEFPDPIEEQQLDEGDEF